MVLDPIFSHFQTNAFLIEKKVRVKSRAFWATVLE